jgi:methionyl-tRNA formyltransferase
VAFFGSDSVLSLRVLDALTAEHRVLGVVQATRRFRGSGLRRPLRGLWLAARRIAGRAPLATAARRAGSPHWFATERGDPALLARLRDLQPDLICLAAYRWILPPEMLAIPRWGAINLHPSLLPRHRGSWPLFWTYYQNDRVAGVTLHRAVAQVDAGAVLAQESVPLPRGYPVAELDRQLAMHGARLVAQGLADIETGSTRERHQDEAAATEAPRVPAGRSVIPFADWDVERVWHFLAGIATHYQESLQDSSGHPVHYRVVGGFDLVSHDRPSGTVEPVPGGWTLYARGGVIHLR